MQAVPPTELFDAEAFQAATGVSRETLERLRAYHDLLLKWQPKINLVGPVTVADAWRRHFLDSAQVFALLPGSASRLIDLGSGAGFPGLVLAILGALDVHLVESDARKCAFLREAARAAGASVTVHNKRIEALGDLQADVVTARALAPVGDLLRLGLPLLKEQGCFLFLKGRNVDAELTEATKYWIMAVQRQPSRSDDQGCVLHLSHVRPVAQGNQ
jgi:16S rRNA (guanine527-N7)-methyltransferase